MAKTFTETFAIIPCTHEHVRPSDVSNLTAAAAADILTGKASPQARGQALVRALVESAYGTPLVKSLITANKRSSAARMLAQCWPILPVCNNSSKEDKRRLLSAAELTEALSAMQKAFDKLAHDKEASKAEKAAPVDTATPEASQEASQEAMQQEEATEATEATYVARESLLVSLLKEALAVRALPKDLKERIAQAI